MPQSETLPARSWATTPEQDDATARVADFRARVENDTAAGPVRLVLEVGEFSERHELDGDAETATIDGRFGFYFEAGGEGGYVSWAELVDVLDLAD